MNAAYEKLQLLLQSGGILEGLRFLNQRVPHRFTAIYQLLDGVMCNRYLVDKTPGAEAPDLSAVPFENSFCQMVLHHGQFRTDNAAIDPVLDGNPYQHIVGSYVGLPLLGLKGELWGTFCHLDLTPQTISDAEFEFLRKVTLMLPRYIALAR